jgi:hypothetical protein
MLGNATATDFWSRSYPIVVEVQAPFSYALRELHPLAIDAAGPRWCCRELSRECVEYRFQDLAESMRFHIFCKTRSSYQAKWVG